MTYEQRRIRMLTEEYRTLSVQPYTNACAPEEIQLTMTDGTQLRTVIRKPEGTGPFPTIIMRSCYPSNEGEYLLHAQEYCARGFAFVYQFCRGVGGSGGRWEPNIHERSDGKDTLEWLAAQDWVECIGYFGCSYLALTGWAVADIVPKKVKTLYLTHYGTDRYTSAYSSGCFRQDVLTSWAMENAGVPVKANFLESAAFMPQIQVDEALWGCRLDWYREIITHTDRNDPYWTEGFWGDLAQIPGRITVPVYLGGSWYDHHLGSLLRTWQSLSEESKRFSTLRLGAWNHDFQPCTPGVPMQHLENSDTASAFSWFRSILQEKETPTTRILSYLVGKDCWTKHSAYPFCVVEEKAFVLSPNKELVPADGVDFRGKTYSWSYRYDPANPVRSHGGEALLWSWDDIGSLEQPPCDWREDVLSFVSHPLEQEMSVLGSIEVELYVSSDVQDTAFTAKLMEVRPDGKAYHIRSGIATLAYRDGSDMPRGTYTPGQTVKVAIKFWDVGWHFAQGCRLRLDISSSDFPQYSVHSNYPGVWSVQTERKTALQTLWCGWEYPSKIILPITEG